MRPDVSVVIPTLRRPELLLRAMASVLSQSVPTFEIIVVVDGVDPQTLAVVETVHDARVRVLQNDVSLGPGSSRNRGVAAAEASWVAFLDDDDEWLPQKLERQLALARYCRLPTIVTTQVCAVTPSGKFVWPLRSYDNQVPLDEYLFDRKSFTKGESFLHLSSLLVSRDLCTAAKFPALRMYEDYVFLLKAVNCERATLLTVPEPLTIVYMEEERPSLSADYSWRASLDWINSVPSLINQKAYSGFCLTTIGPQAAAQGDYRAFLILLREAFRKGRPRARHIAFYCLAWILPVNLRHLRRRLRRLAGWGSTQIGVQG
jgi:glycosyltransferase involved in cell wall biosynthesis